MKYILARNVAQAEAYRANLELDRKDVFLIGDVNSIRGRSIKESDEILRVGTWYQRPDLHDIERNIDFARQS